MTWLIMRVHDWLRSHGYGVGAEGVADSAIAQELERRRSFQRTREATSALKAGVRDFDRGGLERALSEFGWQTSRTLRPHQLDGAAHALTAINAANFSVPGSGKTVTTLAAAVAHIQSGTVDLIVVVGPLACFDPWEQEARAAIGGRIEVRRVRGNARSRRAVYEQVGVRQVLLLSYATAAADQLLLLRLFRYRQVMLVVDESHRIKRFRGGVWAPALMELARHARVRQILSGTPMPQSGKDLYTQLNVLWPDGLLTGTRDAFAAQVETDFDGVLGKIGPFVSRTPKEALGLSPYEVIRHAVDLRATQAEIYALIYNQFRRHLQDAQTWQDKLNALRRGRPIRLLQAAANPALFNVRDSYYRLPRLEERPPTLMERLAAYPQKELPAKSLAALDLVASIMDRQEKVVCWSNFVANLDHFRKLVHERLGVPCFQIDGRVPAGTDALRDDPNERCGRPGEEDTREVIIQRFLANESPAVLITNPASCSESISLHSSCHNAIYLDRTYDCALFLQSIDRIHRLGLPPDAKVTIHILLATFGGGLTIDHLVDTALQAKDARMRLLLEGANLGPISLSDDPSADAEGDEQDLEALLRYLLGEGS
ncbi:SNF2-related protein [Candidatus Thiosymbion oneisti]|uniref:SNF2-related protein n=1 Tax=Candidatus Thiosymbion oneisti TaxID=589554 RepID=UPI00159F0F78|nr:DEAD/DEAH box helicase [Candidatus Thiosymbion oneisti]